MIINYDGDVLTVDGKVPPFKFKWCEPFFVDTMKPLPNPSLDWPVRKILWQMPYMDGSECAVKQISMDETVRISPSGDGYFWAASLATGKVFSESRFASIDEAKSNFELKVLDKPVAVGKGWWFYTDGTDYAMVQATANNVFVFCNKISETLSLDKGEPFKSLERAKLAAVKSLDLVPDFSLLRVCYADKVHK